MNLNRTNRQPSQAPHEAQAEREAFEGGTEVREAEPLEWLDATLGPLVEHIEPVDVPHVRGELVKTLKAAPLASWSLS